MSGIAWPASSSAAPAVTAHETGLTAGRSWLAPGGRSRPLARCERAEGWRVVHGTSVHRGGCAVEARGIPRDIVVSLNQENTGMKTTRNVRFIPRQESNEDRAAITTPVSFSGEEPDPAVTAQHYLAQVLH